MKNKKHSKPENTAPKPNDYLMEHAIELGKQNAKMLDDLIRIRRERDNAMDFQSTVIAALHAIADRLDEMPKKRRKKK